MPQNVSPLSLPAPPQDQSDQRVKAWSQPITIPTYEQVEPERYPMFLDRRVYQGSSGRVYPLPYIERIETEPRDRQWQALHLQNDWLRVMILPEIGGRVHLIRDLTTGEDLIYRQDIIKPALVGLAGPWCSGGIEFNWPQHHRPATYMPVDWSAEQHDDGSITFWLSDHDPMERIKGMHGLRLHPDRACVELHAQLHNRTDQRQTFLWWANVATEVHEQYQSFFPPDVQYVFDHAKRACSRFPLCEDRYYGVNYGERSREGVPALDTPNQFVPDAENIAPNDLSWYANIPVPTSYMCTGTRADFAGGYDHRSQVGLVHVADHTISPGKKQWTWGNHEFGYAWDRQLTEPDENGIYRPYIELMAGVFTDNQPDFSFLAPGETRQFQQTWYAIHQIGPATSANERAAISLNQLADASGIRIGICVTQDVVGAQLSIDRDDEAVMSQTFDAQPGKPFVVELPERSLADIDGCLITIQHDVAGKLLEHHFVNQSHIEVTPAPESATEPPAPQEIESNDELYVTGLHLAQYRHATRAPEPYWQEALRRDPGDSRCHTAMGTWHLDRGELDEAVDHFEQAIARMIRRNPNPADGEAHMQLGRALRYQGKLDDAYEAFGKAAWLLAWQPAAWFAQAQINACKGNWLRVTEQCQHLVDHHPYHGRGQCLLSIALKKLGQDKASRQVLDRWLKRDPLDPWGQYLAHGSLPTDGQTAYDIAWEMIHLGQWDQAQRIIEKANASPTDGVDAIRPMMIAYCQLQQGQTEQANKTLESSRLDDATFGFPARLSEYVMLQTLCEIAPQHVGIRELIGNWLFDRRRHAEAIEHWEAAIEQDTSRALSWRNLGIGYFNVQRDYHKASQAYVKACEVDPTSYRLLVEQDQLAKLVGQSPDDRLARFESHPEMLSQRDDLTIAYAELLNDFGKHEQAIEQMLSRDFQPWEGGEGKALGQFKRAHLALSAQAIQQNNSESAITHAEAILNPPYSLGEAWHLLVNLSDVWYALGHAYQTHGNESQAKAWWQRAANFEGDFVEMAVQSYSVLTLWSALAKRELGQESEAESMLNALLNHARELEQTPAKIDYFATSLPTMLLFHDDLDRRQQVLALTMQAQALGGLGQLEQAQQIIERAIELDRYDTAAVDAKAWLESLK